MFRRTVVCCNSYVFVSSRCITDVWSLSLCDQSYDLGIFNVTCLICKYLYLLLYCCACATVCYDSDVYIMALTVVRTVLMYLYPCCLPWLLLFFMLPSTPHPQTVLSALLSSGVFIVTKFAGFSTDSAQRCPCICLCRHSNSFLNGYCSIYEICLDLQ